MERCPLCRAALHGADTCRRCRADLRTAQEVERDGQALFGPVLISPPTGPAALRLWDLVVGWLEFPQVYELQLPKQRSDIASIARAFAPYLEARDWQSVQRPTP